jgi:hypothetical protein
MDEVRFGREWNAILLIEHLYSEIYIPKMKLRPGKTKYINKQQTKENSTHEPLLFPAFLSRRIFLVISSFSHSVSLKSCFNFICLLQFSSRGKALPSFDLLQPETLQKYRSVVVCLSLM